MNIKFSKIAYLQVYKFNNVEDGTWYISKYLLIEKNKRLPRDMFIATKFNDENRIIESYFGKIVDDKYGNDEFTIIGWKISSDNCDSIQEIKKQKRETYIFPCKNIEEEGYETAYKLNNEIWCLFLNPKLYFEKYKVARK